METKTNLFKALANFQQEVPIIHKDTQGYGYTYADLSAIFKVINPILKKNGLGFTQLIQGSAIQTILFHVETGETLESLTDIPQNVSLAKMNEYQVLGSAITYLRRYSLSSILGIITDKDIDCAGEKTNSLIQNNSLPPILTENESKIIAEIGNAITIDELTKIYQDNPNLQANIKAILTKRKSEILKLQLNGNASN